MLRYFTILFVSQIISASILISDFAIAKNIDGVSQKDLAHSLRAKLTASGNEVLSHEKMLLKKDTSQLICDDSSCALALGEFFGTDEVIFGGLKMNKDKNEYTLSARRLKVSEKKITRRETVSYGDITETGTVWVSVLAKKMQGVAVKNNFVSDLTNRSRSLSKKYTENTKKLKSLEKLRLSAIAANSSEKPEKKEQVSVKKESKPVSELKKASASPGSQVSEPDTKAVVEAVEDEDSSNTGIEDVVRTLPQETVPQTKDDEEYITEAKRLLELGDMKGAVESYKKAIDVNPENYLAFCELGAVYYKMGKPDNALFYLKKSLDLNDDYYLTHYNLGLVYNRIGKSSLARREYEKVIAQRPDYVSAYNNIASIAERSGNLEEAIEYYKLALSKDDNYCRAYYNLGLLHERKEPAKASEFYEGCIKCGMSGGKNGRIWVNKAQKRLDILSAY